MVLLSSLQLRTSASSTVTFQCVSYCEVELFPSWWLQLEQRNPNTHVSLHLAMPRRIDLRDCHCLCRPESKLETIGQATINTIIA